MKRLLIKLILLVICLSTVQASFADGELVYNIISERQAELSRCYSDAYGEVVVPRKVTINGSVYEVKRICKEAFLYCSRVISVTIPESVTQIGDRAFAHCSNLKMLNISAGVTTIGENIFEGCTSLTAIEVDVNNACFASIDGILYDKSISTLIYCPSKTTIVTLPNSVSTIQGGNFENCTQLTSIEAEADNPYFTSVDGVLYNKTLSFIQRVPPQKETITILSSITEIKPRAFHGCFRLTTIMVPEGVTKIGGGAFYGCYNLTDIAIPNGVTEISSMMFQGCKRLTSITIPEGVTKIGGGAFRGCAGLTAIIIPNNVVEIGCGAFEECTGLATIAIPNSVTDLEFSAFKNCTALASVTLSNKIKVIEHSTFWGCTSLSTLTIPEGVTKISRISFIYSGIASLTIPNSVTEIEYEAFESCDKLESIVIGNGVTTINYNTFRGCTNLTSITLPPSISEIGEYPFVDCPNKKNVYISDLSKWCGIQYARSDSNPLYYGGNLYLNGELLTDLVIPDDVSLVGKKAFYNCESITSITIPQNVILDYSCFYGCTNVKAVYCHPTTPPSVTASSFDNMVESEATLYVPIGCKAIYEANDNWYAFWDIQEMDFSGIEETSTEKIVVYPNPVDDVLYVKGVKAGEAISLDNLSGRTLRTVQATEEEGVIDTSDLPNGIYFCRVAGQTVKVVKR